MIATNFIEHSHSQLMKELLKSLFELLGSILTAKEFLLSQPMHSLIPHKERTRIVNAQSFQELLEVCSGKFRWYDSMALEELFDFIRRNGLEMKTKHLKDEILEGIRLFFDEHGRIIKDPSSGHTILMVDSYLHGLSDSDEYMRYKLYHLARGALSLKKDDVLNLQDTQLKKDLTTGNYSQVGNLPARNQYKTCPTKWKGSEDSSLGDSISDADADIYTDNKTNYSPS